MGYLPIALNTSMTTTSVSRPAMAIAAVIRSALTLAMNPRPAMTRRTAMRITVWNALLSKRPEAILLSAPNRNYNYLVIVSIKVYTFYRVEP